MKFDTHYSKLNDRQKEAVDAIFGSVLVIAGPWSGKTELLAVRIANILKQTDANPSNILCLTFTENAAQNMRERLRRIIGSDAYKVAIHTFHSFGMEIMNRFRYRLGTESEFTPVDPVESSRIFRDILSTLPWDHPWKKQSRLSAAIHSIKLLKDAGLDPQDFSAILEKNEQLLNEICPILKKYSERIYSLGQKKDEKIQKVTLFGEMTEALTPILTKAPSHHGLHETLAPVLLRSLEETTASITSPSDSRPITQWKNNWLLVDGISWKLQEEEKIQESRGLVDIYTAYQDALEKRGLIDFSDMILRAIALIETDDQVAATLAEQYQWVMIDEYQDTNDAQLRLITSILAVSPETPNIFAVGDDDQSIYKFQGANVRNIRLLYEMYPDTQLIVLENNYRSYQEIITFSRSIIDEKLSDFYTLFHKHKSFHAHRGTGGIVESYQFPGELEELSWIANDIITQVQNGVPLHEIAVITKKNTTLEYIAKILLSHNIPVTLSKDENIRENEIVELISNILLYIHSLTNHTDRDDLLITILSHPMWQIHRLTLWEISRQIYHAKKEENTLWIEVLRKHSDKNLSKIAHFFIELSLQSHTLRLEDIIDIITGVHHIHISDEYDDIWSREQFSLVIDNTETTFVSPLYKYYFSQNKLKKDPTLYARHLANMRKFVESVRSFRENEGRLLLQDFATYMHLVDEYDVPLTASVLIGNNQSVQCITAHKAKGLEYSHVYAIGLTEKQYKRGKNTGNPFPANLPLSPEKDNDDDILRLVYTVCTRAKDRLVLSYAEKTLEEKPNALLSVLWSLEKWTVIDGKLSENTNILLETAEKDIFSLPYTGEESAFLQNILTTKFTLSVTALQSFLNITDQGPLHFISNNVLRFPQAKHEAAMYGTAIHKALEDFFKHYNYKKEFVFDILPSSFEKSLKKEGLEVSKETELLEKGKAHLEALFPFISRAPYEKLHLEYRFNESGGIHIPFDAIDANMPASVKISGAIDRIEETSEGKLIITDYKTGKALTSLSESGGDQYEKIKKWKYRLQLVFYALLFKRSAFWKAWKQFEYRLLFVEPDKKTGEFHEIIEHIQPTEIERLEKLIQAVMKKVYTLDFPDTSKYEPTIQGIRQFEEDLINWQI